MSAQIQPQGSEQEAAATGLQVGRRRLLRGGLAGAPVLLSLASKPVLAGTCNTGSTFGSANLSHHAALKSCSGNSPDYWKQCLKYREWPTGYAPTSATVACTTAINYTPSLGSAATLFDDVFGSLGGFPGATFASVLNMSGSTGRIGVARHSVAAVLNAAKGLTPADVLSVQKAKYIWSSYVRRGCYEPTAGILWYPDNSEPSSPTGGLIAWMKTTMPITA